MTKKKVAGSIFPCTKAELASGDSIEAIKAKRGLQDRLDDEARLRPKQPSEWTVPVLVGVFFLVLGAQGIKISRLTAEKKSLEGTVEFWRGAAAHETDKADMATALASRWQLRTEACRQDIKVVSKLAMECAQDHPKWGRSKP